MKDELTARLLKAFEEHGALRQAVDTLDAQ